MAQPQPQPQPMPSVMKLVRTFHNHSTVNVATNMSAGLSSTAHHFSTTLASQTPRVAIYALLELWQDGTLVVGSQHQLKRWSSDGQTCLQTFHGHSGVRELAQITRESFLSASLGATTEVANLKRWSLKTGQCIQTFVGPQSFIMSLILLPNWTTANNNDNSNDNDKSCVSGDANDDDGGGSDGKEVVIACGSCDNLIWLWKINKKDEETDNDESFKQLVGHSAAVWSLCELHNGTIVSGSADATIRLWSIVNKRDTSASNVERHTLKGHTSTVVSLFELDVEKHLLVSGSVDGTIRVWATNSATSLCTFNNKSDSVVSMIRWNNACFLALGQNDLRVWTPSGRRIMTHCLPNGFSLLKLKKQDDMLLTGHLDGTISMWSLAPMRLVDWCCLSIALQTDSKEVEKLKMELPFELIECIQSFKSTMNPWN